MNDMLRIARRGLEILPRAAFPLFAASAAWTGLNAMTPWLNLGPLLLGPALVGLFHVALKALREQDPQWQDAFIAVREPATPLVAGIVFALPFAAWNQLSATGQAMKVSMFATADAAIPGVPMIVSLFVLVFFCVYIFVFARLSDTGGTLAEAVTFAHGLAERPGKPDSRLSGLGRQIVYCSVVFIAVLIVGLTWRVHHGAPFLFSILVAPPAVAMLAAWHDERVADASAAAGAGADASSGAGSAEDGDDD